MHYSVQPILVCPYQSPALQRLRRQSCPNKRMELHAVNANMLTYPYVPTVALGSFYIFEGVCRTNDAQHLMQKICQHFRTVFSIRIWDTGQVEMAFFMRHVHTWFLTHQQELEPAHNPHNTKDIWVCCCSNHGPVARFS